MIGYRKFEQDTVRHCVMLGIGFRIKEADRAWQLLDSLSRSAVWICAGAYMRHDRLQRGPLAQRLAMLMRKQNHWWHRSRE